MSKLDEGGCFAQVSLLCGVLIFFLLGLLGVRVDIAAGFSVGVGAILYLGAMLEQLWHRVERLIEERDRDA
jgi:hypothetical protein